MANIIRSAISNRLLRTTSTLRYNNYPTVQAFQHYFSTDGNVDDKKNISDSNTKVDDTTQSVSTPNAETKSEKKQNENTNKASNDTAKVARPVVKVDLNDEAWKRSSVVSDMFTKRVRTKNTRRRGGNDQRRNARGDNQRRQPARSTNDGENVTTRRLPKRTQKSAPSKEGEDENEKANTNRFKGKKGKFKNRNSNQEKKRGPLTLADMIMRREGDDVFPPMEDCMKPVPLKVRDEIFRKHTLDPVANSFTKLALAYGYRAEKVAAIVKIVQHEMDYEAEHGNFGDREELDQVVREVFGESKTQAPAIDVEARAKEDTNIKYTVVDSIESTEKVEKPLSKEKQELREKHEQAQREKEMNKTDKLLMEKFFGVREEPHNIIKRDGAFVFKDTSK